MLINVKWQSAVHGLGPYIHPSSFCVLTKLILEFGPSHLADYDSQGNILEFTPSGWTVNSYLIDPGGNFENWTRKIEAELLGIPRTRLGLSS